MSGVILWGEMHPLLEMGRVWYCEKTLSVITPLRWRDMEGSSKRRFPNRIRQLRMERGWTQGELARMMGYESVSSLASLEAGKKLPSMRTLIKLEAAFQRPFRDLYPRYFDAVYDPVAERRSAFFRERAVVASDR